MRITDAETNQVFEITGQLFGPTINDTNESIVEEITFGVHGAEKTKQIVIPPRPTEAYQVEMWEAIDGFENRSWSPKNVGLKTGFPKLDKAFDGGLYPGFYIIAGDSNLGKQ